ncbi:histidine kinase [Micromonospora acroterricola]|uniref:Histidine kinase n=1 Tax=Micromonospora acroterricola TaxID=2202421 RepID=A0A317CTR8_9ACTN|nr:GAF and ANTAR domain-containing protein [Micromonospora acroterricola]PWR05552.1 histidine kinase [Micromonospora acroterricola]
MGQASPYLESAFAELGRMRLDEVGLDEMLQRIADLANRSVPGAQDVSVTLVRGGNHRPPVVTSDLARDLDTWQYQHGYGPCLDSSPSGDSISVPDTTSEPRWPGWAEYARSRGIGSSLSIGLPIQEAAVGALNVYAAEAHAFDREATDVAEQFAAYAAVALSNAHLYDTTATLAQQMREAMRSRAVIEQAKGIIMGERRCSPEEAFALMSKISQDSNRKVRDVAEALVARAIGTRRD